MFSVQVNPARLPLFSNLYTGAFRNGLNAGFRGQANQRSGARDFGAHRLRTVQTEISAAGRRVGANGLQRRKAPFRLSVKVRPEAIEVLHRARKSFGLGQLGLFNSLRQ